MLILINQKYMIYLVNQTHIMKIKFHYKCNIIYISFIKNITPKNNKDLLQETLINSE